MANDRDDEPEEAAEAEPSTQLASDEEFVKALDEAVKLAECGALHWRISGNGFISPRLDDDVAADSVGAKNSAHRTTFERILEREIAPGVNRAARVPFIDTSRLSKKDRKLAAERDRIISDKLYSDALRERVQIRRTSKGTVLEELRWDVSVKKHDLRDGSIPDVPFATIELTFANAPSDKTSPFSFFEMIGASRHTVCFDCHLDDLAAIIRDLTELRNNLAKLPRQGAK